MELLGRGEFLPSRNATDQAVEQFCDEEAVTAEVCYNFLFLIAGPDPELVNKVGTALHICKYIIQPKYRKQSVKISIESIVQRIVRACHEFCCFQIHRK